jgi:SOS-response transcriptional repressor LexA
MGETCQSGLREIVLRGRIALGMSARALADKAGVSHSYISQIERGIIRRPSLLVLKRLARIMPAVSYSDLLKAAGYVFGQTALADNSADSERQRQIAQRLLEVAGEITREAAQSAARGFRCVPLYASVPASFGIATAEVMMHDEVESLMLHESRLRGDSQAYALRVHGDSMAEAGILEGDVVVVSPASSWRSGDVCVVRIGASEHSLKRLVVQGELIILQPCNCKYEPLVLPPERQAELHVCGKVILCERAFP